MVYLEDDGTLRWIDDFDHMGDDMTNAAEAYEVYLAMILYRLVTNEWKKQTAVGTEVFNSENHVGTVQHSQRLKYIE